MASGRRRLTENITVEVLTLVIYQGVTITEIAAELGMSRGHLSRVVNAFRREYRVTSEKDIETQFRDLAPKCVEVISEALTDRRNVHKSASLGIRVLYMLGVYKRARQDAQQGNAYSDVDPFRDLPADWYGKYISSDPEPPRRQIGGKS